MGNKLDL